VDDTVVLLASGHGARDPGPQATFYYVTHEADLDGDGWLSIAELEPAVKLMVGGAAMGLQHPSIDRENPLQELRLPLLR
jgi:hypothetical protein